MNQDHFPSPAEDSSAIRRFPDLNSVVDLVRDQVAQVLVYVQPNMVKVDQSFKDAGFDSIAAVQLCNRLNDVTNLSLPDTVAFDYPTPLALAEYLFTLTGGEATTETPAASHSLQESPAQEGEVSVNDPIAIVGMACRYPGGVRSAEGLWDLISAGKDATTEFPTDRGWDVAALYNEDPDHAGTSYTKRGGFLEGAAEFDPRFFGISPHEALAMDPQQRLLLETSWEAIESAGINPRALRGTNSAVFAGLMYHDYASKVDQAPGELEGHLTTGKSGGVLSGRVSYVLGLEGPAVTVDTACSSSLVALHWAVQSLRSGETSLALAGGVTVMSHPATFVEFSRQRGLSADGRCRSYAGSADGTGFAEGVGVLVVERLSDAVRHGHRVLAVVRGSAVNQDGASNGLTAPSGRAQERVVRQALSSAGLKPGDVDVVEGHGTGTRLGDPIEVGALAETYGRERSGAPLLLGSVKSNLGHTQAAAGVAGVIKMVQAMQHGVAPASLHVDTPSPHAQWGEGVELVTAARAWPASDRPRRAGVSSFGVSGTNAHVILEQAPPVTPPTRKSGGGVVPWLLSGRTADALRDQTSRLRAHLDAHPELDPADIGYTLAVGRAHFEHRAVAMDGDLTTWVAEGTAVAHREVVFVFPGQGAQWVGMGQDLIKSSPVFAASMAQCEQALAPFVDWSLSEVLGDASMLERVDVVQPASWAVMVSLAGLWQSMGVTPSAVAGHSQGEIAAACVAGALSLDDGARVVALRSQLIRDKLAGSGAMASISLPLDEVREHLTGLEGLSVAAVNGPRSVVISGDVNAVENFVAARTDEGTHARIVAVDYASHSAHVDTIEQDLTTALTDLHPTSARIPFYSTVTGAPIDTTELNARYWVQNLRQTVRFEDVTRRLIDDGRDTFIEISAHPVLGIGLQDTFEDHSHSPAITLSSLRRDDGDIDRFLTSLSEAHVHGVDIDWHTAFTDHGAQRIQLPTYPFQHDHYWLENVSRRPDVDAAGQEALHHILANALVELAQTDGLLLTGCLSESTHPWIADHIVGGVMILPASAWLELAFRAGAEVGADHIEELTLEAPLVFRKGARVKFQVALSAPDADGRRAVSVHSQSGTGWVRHAVGSMVKASTQDAGKSTTAVEEWPPTDATALDLSGAYEGLVGRGYDYGPAFQCLRAAWRSDEDVFAEVALPGPDVGGSGAFLLHPALLDALLQSLLVADLNQEAQQIRMPFAWTGVSLYEPGASVLRCRISRRQPDTLSLSITQTTGRPVASVESLVLRPISAEKMGTAEHAESVREVRARQATRPDDTSLRHRLANLSANAKIRALVDLVRTHAAAVLGYKESSEEIGARTAFTELGLGSMEAVQLRNKLNAATGLRLPTTFAFEYSTAEAMARKLCDELFPVSSPSSEPEHAPDEPAAAGADADSADLAALIEMAHQVGDI
ncbi:Acyl transferase domain-containing protein [Streptomyces sp. 2224.1]|uniref:type I polyketide synthase n=1 Tax=Streptomyces sp. 2224.1 TaxID=1881020 RepID=UPI000897D16D|nr:type I polyketide synthase [Streptomyces sp. 2224.1]SED45667.1 Acyl transferase domain-containing protein [Streptomyces sp. 2224.1]